MSRTPPKPVPMACLTIGHYHYLLPAAKAIKAAEILQDAFDCEHHYDDGDFVYEVASTQPRVRSRWCGPTSCDAAWRAHAPTRASPCV